MILRPRSLMIWWLLTSVGGGVFGNFLNQKNEKVLELHKMARNHIFPFWGGVFRNFLNQKNDKVRIV